MEIAITYSKTHRVFCNLRNAKKRLSTCLHKHIKVEVQKIAGKKIVVLELSGNPRRILNAINNPSVKGTTADLDVSKTEWDLNKLVA